MGAVDDSCWLLCVSGDGGNSRGFGSRSREILVGGRGLLLQDGTSFSIATLAAGSLLTMIEAESCCVLSEAGSWAGQTCSHPGS